MFVYENIFPWKRKSSYWTSYQFFFIIGPSDRQDSLTPFGNCFDHYPPNLATIVCPARANLSPNIKKHCLHSAFLYFCKILIFSSLVLVFHSLYAAYLRTLAEFIHSFHKFFWKLWTTIRLLLCFLSVFFWIFVFFSVYDLLRPNMSNCLVMPWKVYYAMQKFNLLFLFLIPFLFCRFLCFRDKFVFFCITFLCFFVSVFFHDDQSYFLLAVVSVYFAVSVPAKGGVLGRTEPPFAPICTHL